VTCTRPPDFFVWDKKQQLNKCKVTFYNKTMRFGADRSGVIY